jgi:deoxyribose-phosphate aldolase
MKYPIITQKDFSSKELAAMIDHSVLFPYAPWTEVEKFLQEAKDYGMKVVCVNNSYTEAAANVLQGTDIKVATVVAFPFGALSPESKAAETELAIKQGARTIDMVVNVGAIKSGNWDLVYRDMAVCAETAHKNDTSIKVIIETCYLTREEKIMVCETAMKADMDFVKTSTGFGFGGFTSAATLGDVKLMKSVVGDKLGVKASGPIADYDTAVAFIHAGAHRIGTRKGIDIIKDCPDWKE